MDDNSVARDLFAGLQALAQTAFPKKCASCGRQFATAEDFVRETEQVRPGVSGLKQSVDDDDQVIVEMFRNCPCGSTLMDAFNNRRDLSEAGQRRRTRFAELVDKLTSAGMMRERARGELLKVMHGQASPELARLLRGGGAHS